MFSSFRQPTKPAITIPFKFMAQTGGFRDSYRSPSLEVCGHPQDGFAKFLNTVEDLYRHHPTVKLGGIYVTDLNFVSLHI